MINISRRITKEERIQQFNNRVIKENLPYNLIYIPNYCTADTYIKIYCCKHDFQFSVSIRSFINNKSKCPKCQKNYHYSKDDYIQRIQDRINEYYLPYRFIDFESEFKNAHSKIILHCDNCNTNWTSTLNNFLTGKGCPICNKSKGEKFIRKILLDKNTNFIQEKKFKTCKDKGLLPFDFYLPDHNILIEYDGQQHFVDGWFDNEDNLKLTKYHDQIKTEWAKENGINLVRYNYKQSFKNIEKELLGLLDSYESRKN